MKKFLDLFDRFLPLLISVVLNLFLLVWLANIQPTQPPSEDKTMDVRAVEVEIHPFEPPPAPEPPETTEVDESQDATLDRGDASSAEADAASDVPDVEAGGGEAEASDGQPNRPSLMAMASGGSELLKLSGAFAGRSQSGRMSGLERGSGSAKTERAVSKALEWLAKHQNPDGSWGGQEGCVASVAPSLRLVASRSESLAAGGNSLSPEELDLRLAVSGLALLTFLAHGETPLSPTYGDTVLKGLMRMVELSKDQRVVINPDGVGHALLTYALAEAYAMTKIDPLGVELDRRTSVIVNRVNRELGNAYSANRWRTLSAWNYQAMAAAHSAGRGGSDLVEAENMAAKSLLARLDGKGIDPASLFGDIHCLQLLGERKNPDVRKALRRLSDSDNGKLLKVNWNKPGPWALYEWHHRGQALFFDDAGKGVAWRRWSKEIAKTLVDHQESDGHWESPMESSGQPDADGETSKTFKSSRTLEVYSTALCALTLEVYYRRLPGKGLP